MDETYLFQTFKDIGLTDEQAIQVLEIIQEYFIEPPITYEEFLNKLTPMEIDALKNILQAINTGGRVVISKLCEQYPISRPVYITLLTKLKEYKIAEVFNNGAKGTTISFLRPDIVEALQCNA